MQPIWVSVQHEKPDICSRDGRQQRPSQRQGEATPRGQLYFADQGAVYTAQTVKERRRLIDHKYMQTILSCSGRPDAAFLMRAMHLRKALHHEVGHALIGLVETFIGSVGPIYDAELVDQNEECGYLARIFDLPNGLYTGQFQELGWHASGKDLVRTAWRNADGVEIYYFVTYRLLHLQKARAEIETFMRQSLIGMPGGHRLYTATVPVLADVRCLAMQAGLPMSEEAGGNTRDKE